MSLKKTPRPQRSARASVNPDYSVRRPLVRPNLPLPLNMWPRLQSPLCLRWSLPDTPVLRPTPMAIPMLELTTTTRMLLVIPPSTMHLQSPITPCTTRAPQFTITLDLLLVLLSLVRPQESDCGFNTDTFTGSPNAQGFHGGYYPGYAAPAPYWGIPSSVQSNDDSQAQSPTAGSSAQEDRAATPTPAGHAPIADSATFESQ